jgi:RNA polymerase sigma-70 factor (ECF subfamily)
MLDAEAAALFRLAYRLTGNRHDAEDLVQDACERALSKAPSLQTPGDCRRWLLRVLYNLYIDGARRRTRSPLVAATNDEVDRGGPAGSVPDPEALAAQAESESALERAWEKLDSAQQILLLLRAEGRSLTEISGITEVAKPALSVRLNRARSKLAKLTDEERDDARALRVAAGRKT